ncbi:MAG: 5-formyltetrahydrofolate cyclo-ligase [Ruminococcus sp.]|nr:5-formyltetrahydrofolate cyclo-ligase [Ruminococcus sp.]
MPVKNLGQKKNELRLKYKKIREEFSREEKAELDKKITERFLNLEQYQSAKNVFAFVSKDIEVNTEDIIINALESGKKVAVPLCDIGSTTMYFCYINSYDDLKEGCYGILEPDRSKCIRAEKNDADIMLVPGLVFDKKGYRLGFGKGFYDRFMCEYNRLTVGVCYSKCIEDELPIGDYDKPADMVVTDRYTIDIR